MNVPKELETHSQHILTLTFNITYILLIIE